MEGFPHLAEVAIDDRFDELVYQVHDQTAFIRLNRPEVLNAFSSQMYREFRDAIRLANVDDNVDIIVITGTARSFATGGDLREVLARVQSDDPLAVYRFDDNVPFETLRESPKTTIAAINGICVAGGLVTAMACDIAIASRDSVFGAPEARVGLADTYVPALMFGRVGMAQMKYLMFTGSSITADRAEQIGIITRAVPAESLYETALEVRDEIRQTSASARATYKAVINRIAPRFEHYDLLSGLNEPDRLDRLANFSKPRASDS